MRTAVVSGAAGFVGYHLIKRLQEENVRVVALCRPKSEHNSRLDEFKNVTVIECDSSGFLLQSENLKQFSPDVFYHLAWDGTTGEKRGDYSVQLANIKNTCDAYTCAANIGCAKFVASGTVYERLTEQIEALNNFSALSYYVMAKQFAYESLSQLSKKVGLDFTWCMFCQPIGKYIKLNQLMAYMINELKCGRIPELGTAENPFDMIVVEDLAEALYLAGNTKLSEKRYYIGSGQPRKLKEYLKRAGELVKPETELIFGERPDDGLVFLSEWLDTTPFMKETGYMSHHSFDEGVMSVASWVDEQNN